MIKGIINLSNGNSISIESDSAEELRDVVSLFSDKKEVEEKQKPVAPTAQRMSPTYGVNKKAWSEKDLASTARIVMEHRDNPSKGYKAVDIFLRNHGEFKKRPYNAVYVMANRIRRYVVNGTNEMELSKSVRRTLNAQGYHPGSANSFRATKVVSKKKQVHQASDPWSPRDILSIARIVKENIGLKWGLSKKVKQHLRVNGDYKNRTPDTIHTRTSQIRQYMLGKENSNNRLPFSTKATLDSHGFSFGSASSTVSPIETQERELVEA